ncbi:conserved exported hypothetical protein [Candidatus Desulfarcum epimagneticum]|uniref:PpiC domain-containing protein n=1 Tax=uncultured Desulfobacteraceae bacterium TaxID=218296 RepID=A0A484HN89_9BACT|nr:conserved exported hypothetical protein [uncultured Desulfobacteraceae bacterium]
MKKAFFLWGVQVAALAFLVAACGVPDAGRDDEDLIRAGKTVITKDDFNRAFELSMEAYDYKLEENRRDFETAMMWRLNQKIEEAVLLEHAGQLEIDISDPELEDEIAKIKQDYPDQVFEDLFLENAVSYDSWKKELRRRLLIERLMKAELGEKIAIGPKDIADYYQGRENEEKIQADGSSDGKAGASAEEINRRIILQIRRKKIEEAYGPWISGLRERYPLQINRELWEAMLDEAGR